MGQPVTLNRVTSVDEFIVHGSHTRGSETSQYPQEKRSNDIARVAASESAGAQTGERAPRGCGAGDAARERIGEPPGTAGRRG